ncbi:MAG TPA: pyruvate kinase [Vicinamibacterales bacterium]|nr:pyruvate kinase [Vicinamibacterales bacterium]
MPATRRTKIIATLGPATSSPAQLDALFAAGVDVVRLNFSHGTHETHAALYADVRAAAARAGRHIAVLQDLSGPKIRTGALQGQALELHEGDELRVAVGDQPGGAGRVFTTYAPLIASARAGDRLLLDDGRIELRVTDTAPDELTTVVVSGGRLGEHKGINAPGVPLPSSAITPKDEDDLRFGLSLGVDMVALSFVQTVEDVGRAREVMRAADRQVPIVAKIERPRAVENLEAILAAADAVMVARGDLGLELPLEHVPSVQKAIIAHARRMGRPAIVATQVLESMRTDPRPTRAEVSDAATAVDQGADAIMLAGETAVGAYPVRAVQTLAAIIVDAESMPTAVGVSPLLDPSGTRHGRAMCEAAVTLATSGQADAIVAVTSGGKTARLLSSLRPPATIFAICDEDAVARMLALWWGLVPIVRVDHSEPEEALRAARVLPPGAVVVYINVSPDLGRADANYMSVQTLA